MAQKVTIESSRGAIALRELKANYFCAGLKKWLKNADNVFIPVEEPSANKSKPKNAQDNFTYIISASMPENNEGESHSDALGIFSQLLQKAEEDIYCRIKKYIPKDWRDTLKPKGYHNYDPLRILSHLKGADSLGLAGSGDFEFLRAMEIAAQYFFYHITRNRQLGKSEKPKKNISQTHNFIKWLKIRADIASRRSVFYLNGDNHWKYTEENEGTTSSDIRKLTLNLSWVTIRTFTAKTIKAAVQIREKDFFEAFAKRFRDPEMETIHDVPDMYGVRFAYEDMDNLEKGIDFFAMQEIFRKCKIKRIQQANRHASRNIKITSQSVYLDGHMREVQHILLPDLINILHSSCSENHALYHLRWYTEKGGLFSQLFPKELYGVDWESDEVREACQKHVIEKINRENRELPPA